MIEMIQDLLARSDDETKSHLHDAAIHVMNRCLADGIETGQLAYRPSNAPFITPTLNCFVNLLIFVVLSSDDGCYDVEGDAEIALCQALRQWGAVQTSQTVQNLLRVLRGHIIHHAELEESGENFYMSASYRVCGETGTDVSYHASCGDVPAAIESSVYDSVLKSDLIVGAGTDVGHILRWSALFGTPEHKWLCRHLRPIWSTLGDRSDAYDIVLKLVAETSAESPLHIPYGSNREPLSQDEATAIVVAVRRMRIVTSDEAVIAILTKNLDLTLDCSEAVADCFSSCLQMPTYRRSETLSISMRTVICQSHGTTPVASSMGPPRVHIGRPPR